MEEEEDKFWIASDSEDEPTLGERVEVAKRERIQEASRSGTGLGRGSRPPETVAKRTKKGRPREISSKRPVPVGRERCLGIDNGQVKERSVRKAFDPRFEDHCGELREEHVERNYSFVTGIREKRRSDLLKTARKDPANEDVTRELERMEQEDSRRKVVQRRKEILRQVRQEEKEAVKRGKKPFFMKQAQLRKLEVEVKYKELKEKGGVKKYIEKRRRRLASKDRKLLPTSRSQL